MRCAIGTLATFLLMAAPASASEFCVAPAGCGGGQRATLQAALDAALGAAGPDTVRLPAGIVQGPGSYETPNLNNSVDIIGAGREATVVTASTGSSILDIRRAGVVSDLTVRQANPPPPSGPSLGSIIGTAERVGFAAVNSEGNSEIFGVGRDLLATGPAHLRIGGTIEDSILSGTALASGTGDTVIQRVRVEAPRPIYGQNRSLRISSSLFVSTSPTGPVASFSPSPVPNSQGTAMLSNVTLIGPNSPSCTGLEINGNNAYPPPEDFAHEQATLASSIVRGCGTSVDRASGGGNRSASLAIFNSDIDLSPAAVSESGAGTLTAGPDQGNINSDPLFVGIPGLPPSPRFDSPVIDRGLISSAFGGESATDLAGTPRIVDGNGDGSAIRDMGAFEYQRRPPVVTVTTAKTATVGTPVTFSGSATESDPGESITGYAWTFDDGATATGVLAVHAFDQPGAHTATLRALDSAGVIGTGTATVLVEGGSVKSISLSPATFRAASKGATASKRGKAPTGTKVKLKLSAPANVTLTVERETQGRRSGKKSCVKVTRGNRGAKACKRYVKLRGSISRKAGQPTRFGFDGRLRGKALPPGPYRMVAKAGSTPPRSGRFQIVP